MHERCQEAKIWTKSPIPTKLAHFIARGRSWPSGGPLGVTFDPKIENLCGNHILWSFCILSKKYFCVPFFRLYLVKIVGFFLTILIKTCFWSNNVKIPTKVVQKMIPNWFSAIFDYIFTQTWDSKMTSKIFIDMAASFWFVSSFLAKSISFYFGIQIYTALGFQK